MPAVLGIVQHFLVHKPPATLCLNCYCHHVPKKCQNAGRSNLLPQPPNRCFHTKGPTPRTVRADSLVPLPPAFLCNTQQGVRRCSDCVSLLGDGSPQETTSPLFSDPTNPGSTHSTGPPALSSMSTRSTADQGSERTAENASNDQPNPSTEILTSSLSAPVTGSRRGRTSPGSLPSHAVPWAQR